MAGEQVGTVGATGNAAVAGRGRTALPMTHIEYRNDRGTGSAGSVDPATVSTRKP